MIDLSTVDTELLKTQRDYLLSINDINEHIDGLINLLDFILDELEIKK